MPITRLLIIFAFPLILGGCVVGQDISMDYSGRTVAVDEANTVRVAVADERPFIKNGDKDPWYIGKYRAGFGNPWDVTTENDVPLAEVVADDLADALREEGFATVTSAESRVLDVKIDDWNFDGYQNGRFWYDLDVTVYTGDGRTVANERFADEIVIKGTLLSGAKGGFERDMPGIYREIVAAVVTDNEILSALRGN